MEFSTGEIYAINKLMPKNFKIEPITIRKPEIDHLQEGVATAPGKRIRREKKFFEFEDPKPQGGEVFRKAMGIVQGLRGNRKLRGLLGKGNRLWKIEEKLKNKSYTNTSELGHEIRNMFVRCY